MCVIYPLLIFYVSQVGLQVDSPLDLCLGKGSRGSKTIRYHPSLNHKPCQLEITVFLWHFLFGRVRTLKEVKIPKKGYGKIQKGAFFFRKKWVHVFFFRCQLRRFFNRSWSWSPTTMVKLKKVVGSTESHCRESQLAERYPLVMTDIAIENDL